MLKLNDVSVIFSQGNVNKIVLEHLTLDIPTGTTIAIMGPSGCGKTTLLRLLAGIISPTSGNVTRETNSISYAFQDPSLLPWLTAAENVNLVLSDSKQTLPMAKEWLGRVGLAEDADRYPAELSGGMKQRVALARALCTDADVLLLDEPFRGLDATLHGQMRELICTVRQGKTTVIVTHDEQDLCMADSCVNMMPDRHVHMQSLNH
jgi:ABC-type nitrate/sulfonate/bicarbonate transport system ATPase subunit